MKLLTRSPNIVECVLAVVASLQANKEVEMKKQKQKNLAACVSGLLLISLEFYILVWFGGEQHQQLQKLNPAQGTFMFFMSFLPVVFGSIAVFSGIQGMIETAIVAALQKETEPPKTESGAPSSDK